MSKFMFHEVVLSPNLNLIKACLQLIMQCASDVSFTIGKLSLSKQVLMLPRTWALNKLEEIIELAFII